LSKQNENGLDDLQSILNVLHECNNGNRVVFSKNEKYIIGTALDVRFLNHIDIGNDNAHLEMNKLTHLTDIQGDIQFTDNTDYWQAESLTWLRK
jgi:galacturan 1,4-alpha-galacturonidase